MKRPEYVLCVVQEAGPPIDLMWCGRAVGHDSEAHFTGATHALDASRTKSRYLICSACATKMIVAIRVGAA